VHRLLAPRLTASAFRATTVQAAEAFFVFRQTIFEAAMIVGAHAAAARRAPLSDCARRHISVAAQGVLCA